MESIIVTGGAGFIGSNFIRLALEKWEGRVVVFDKLTYAGSLHNLESVSQHPRYVFVKGDIAEGHDVRKVFEQYAPRYVINFAAESHVDRSIDSPAEFIRTNVQGTFVMLEAALHYYRQLNSSRQKEFRFLQVSTDEVYGTLGETGLFVEETPYSPNSPYSASKASADHFVLAYHHTYHLPTVITNCSNNYGPYQFPEKLLPLVILNAIEGKHIPVYGDGGNIRDWLHVSDHCRAIYQVLEKGRLGEKYNIGGNNEHTNLEAIDRVCDFVEGFFPASKNSKLLAAGYKKYSDLKKFVKDRPGHDRRYAIDSSKIQKELNWKPEYNFENGLKATVQWYLENQEWCQKVQQNNYNRERLGLKVETKI